MYEVSKQKSSSFIESESSNPVTKTSPKEEIKESEEDKRVENALNALERKRIGSSLNGSAADSKIQK